MTNQSMEIKKILDKVEALKDIGDEWLEKLAQKSEIRKLEQGQTLLRLGIIEQSAFVVLEGWQGY